MSASVVRLSEPWAGRLSFFFHRELHPHSGQVEKLLAIRNVLRIFRQPHVLAGKCSVVLRWRRRQHGKLPTHRATTLDYTPEFHVVRPVKYSSPPATRLGRTGAAAPSRSTPASSNCAFGPSAITLSARPQPPGFPARAGLSLPPAVARKSHP